MSITIDDVNETRIVWTTNLTFTIGGDAKKELVRLNRSLWSSNFEISCASHISPEQHRYAAYAIELSLMLVDDGGWRSNNNKEKDATLEYYSRPSVVWASVNNGEKFPLKASAGSDEYKSGKISVSIHRTQAQTFTFKLLINFPNFDRGEKNLLKDLTALFVKQSNCDIHFCFEGEDEQHKLGAHVNILATRSSVFAAMFQHDMKESTTGKVYIQDVQLNIFTELLHYIYSGRTKTEINEDTAQPLYIAADKYYIEDLKKECVHFLVSSIKVENIIRLLVWAHLHLVDELKTKAFKFIAKHGKAVCQLDDWANLMKQYPELCLLATRYIMGIVSIA